VYDAASEQASQWACDVCTFSENAAYTAECQVCGTPKAPPPPPPPQEDAQHGAAQYAPYHDPHAAAVEQHQQKQQQQQQQADDGGDGDDAAAWACGVCTFENDGAYRDCEMCGAARVL
jgi:hypothetical protein